MQGPLPIFIGYDPREHVAYEVAASSICRSSSQPVLVTPLYLPHLTHVMNRYVKRDEDGKLWCPISEAAMSTEFATSRFCVPFIQEQSWALFTDCDVLCQADIAELFALADERYAVMVVKHDYSPGEGVKMDFQQQSAYPRKLWSSVVLWNAGHVAHRRLTRDRLNYWPGRDLHAFKWLEDDEIGELPAEWNHLVGIDLPTSRAKLLHFTLGVPNMPGYENCQFSDAWRRAAYACGATAYP